MKARLCPGVYRFLPIDDQHPKFARYKKRPRTCRGQGSSAGEKGLVTGRYRRAVTAEAVIEAQGDHIHILADPAVTKAASTGLRPENELLASPMNRWSYSRPTDQFGAKPYSNPTPTTPPQRVELADANSMPVSRFEDAKAVACHRRAALYVK